MGLIAQLNPLPTTPIQVTDGGLTTARIFPTVTGGLVAEALLIEGNGKHESAQIEFEADGWALCTGASPTLNVTFYNGTSLTPGSNTVLGALGSGQSVTINVPVDWSIKATLQGSTKTGFVQGKYQIFINNVLAAAAALSNKLTGISFVTNPALSLLIGLTFGVADSGNIGQRNRSFAYRNDAP